MYREANLASSQDFTFKTAIVSIILLILFIGGTSTVYYLFADENWTLKESIYFSIVTLTSVGYGDLYPKKNIGKIINVIFIFFSVFLFLVLIRLLVGYLVEFQIEFLIKRLKKKKEIEKRKSIENITNLDNISAINSVEVDDDATEFLNSENESSNNENENCCSKNKFFWIHLAFYFIFLLTWTLFYALYPGENLSWLDSIYFAVVTSATVGYGDLSPQTPGGVIFASVFILIGVISLGVLASDISNRVINAFKCCCVKSNKNNVYGGLGDREKAINECLVSIKKGEGILTRDEFISKMLIATSKCKSKDIESLLKTFNNLDITGNGVLDSNDFEIFKQQTFGTMGVDVRSSYVDDFDNAGDGTNNNTTKNNNQNKMVPNDGANAMLDEAVQADPQRSGSIDGGKNNDVYDL